MGHVRRDAGRGDRRRRGATRGTDAYLDFVRRHHRLGFTDFSTVAPTTADMAVLRAIATDVLPELRAGNLLA
jgi:hypothetical protein